MSNYHESEETYILGHKSEAVQRLLRQGQMLNPFTPRLLEDAGISRGMKVLDVGCGPGDVSLIVAELVGEEGSVLGVDTNASALQVAQARAQATSLKQVSFLAADIHDLPLEQEFDAVVGRLILQHMPEPISTLRRLVSQLRPGSIVAFQEFDIPDQSDATMPASPLWGQAINWCRYTFQRAGVELRMGMKLYSTFLAAGLPVPQLRYEAPIGVGPEWIGYEVLADTVRVLLPLIQKFDIITVEEIEIETLAQRLRDEIVGLGGVARFLSLVSAWTRTV